MTGLSQEGLAHDAGTGRTFISELERGKKGPSLKTIFALADSLDVSPAEIVARVQTLFGERRK